MSATTGNTIRITVGSWNVTNDVVWKRTSFTSSANAQPGTCQIYLRASTPAKTFEAGSRITLRINDELKWQGFLFVIEQGYVFPDDPDDLSWVLSGVDLNILFDKLILYNHEHPTWRPSGGGAFQSVATEGGYIIQIPQGTMDRDYIVNMMADTDISSAAPWINTTSLITEYAVYNPDGPATPINAGSTMRDLFVDVSRNVARLTPGSIIWYIDPQGYLIYRPQDTESGPRVGDDGTGINVRDLSVTTDISSIRNDVLIFTGNLNPDPNSSQEALLYSRQQSAPSISRYGRFQYSEEPKKENWSQAIIDATAKKIVYQQGLPARRVNFVTFESDFYPGQIITVSSAVHLFRYYDPVLGDVESSTINVPIRQISMRFPTPDVVKYEISCSADTQDPWGLLLALRRPPSTGIDEPAFLVIDRTKSNPDPLMGSAPVYTFVREYPTALGGKYYQCSYGYIRYSISVFVDGLKVTTIEEGGSGTVGFIETSPSEGIFQIGQAISAGQKVYVEYHVLNDL